MNTGLDVTYSMDTSAFIDGLNRYYPIENFPALWELFDDLVNSNRVIAHWEVWKELNPEDETEAKSEVEAEDPAKAWVETNNRMGLFIDTDLEIAGQVNDIKEIYPNWKMEVAIRLTHMLWLRQS